MAKLEKEIERRLTAMVQRRGGACLKWVCPGWAGVPDRIILLPGGYAIFCELKRPKGGIVDPLQQWWKKRLQSFGFLVFHIKNTEEIEQLELLIIELMGQR